MKKVFLICLILLLSVCLIFTFISCNQPTEEETPPSQEPQNEMMQKVEEIYSKATTAPQTITTIHDLAILTSVNYTVDGEGPIGVASATLNNENYTLITLGGTEFIDGQATTIKESQQAAMGQDNDYLTALIKLFTDGTIPKERPIMITGISLGGMIAQQILGKTEVTDTFDIKYIITFGSPLTQPLNRHGATVIRFEDKKDMVPNMGESMLPMFGISQSEIKTAHSIERISKSSKYKDMPDVHALSYVEDECWNDIDFLGAAPGTNTLITTSQLKYYDAPIISY